MASEIVKIDDWFQLKKLDKGGGVLMPFVQEIFLLECAVAGTWYVKKIKKRVAGLSKGTVVSLKREPENVHDFFAILVNNPQGEKLGYVPRDKNEVLARLLDAGKILYGKVSFIQEDDYEDDSISIGIQIYMKDL